MNIESITRETSKGMSRPSEPWYCSMSAECRIGPKLDRRFFPTDFVKLKDQGVTTGLFKMWESYCLRYTALRKLHQVQDVRDDIVPLSECSSLDYLFYKLASLGIRKLRHCRSHFSYRSCSSSNSLWDCREGIGTEFVLLSFPDPIRKCSTEDLIQEITRLSIATKSIS